MALSYSRPLELGWRRTRSLLLQPFDLGRWLVLGFTAWLAQLADGTGSGSEGVRIVQNLEHDSAGAFAGSARDWVGGLVGSQIGLAVAAVLVTGVIVVALLALWIASRGRFMFLDNLVHRRTEVVAPWREYRREGDSLFLWRLVFSLVSLVVIGALVGGFVLVIVPLSFVEVPRAIGLPLAIGLGTALFLAVVVLAYVEYFLDQFIVPLMHRHRLGATAAWSRFLSVFRTRPLAFVLMGLLTAAISVAVSIAFALAGLLTCCFGLLLMALPYLGAVVTLPLPVLVQHMNLEFLAQFGDDFRLLDPIDGVGGSGQFDADGTVVRPHDLGQDPRTGEPGPQAP